MVRPPYVFVGPCCISIWACRSLDADQFIAAPTMRIVPLTKNRFFFKCHPGLFRQCFISAKSHSFFIIRQRLGRSMWGYIIVNLVYILTVVVLSMMRSNIYDLWVVVKVREPFLKLLVHQSFRMVARLSQTQDIKCQDSMAPKYRTCDLRGLNSAIKSISCLVIGDIVIL